jgi:hypothetical protein
MDTLSPALTAWLARFSAEVAPQFTWYVNSRGALRGRHGARRGLCPLQADYFMHVRRKVPEQRAFLNGWVAGLSQSETITVTLAADSSPSNHPLYSPALRTALLTACGVEEAPHAPTV